MFSVYLFPSVLLKVSNAKAPARNLILSGFVFSYSLNNSNSFWSTFPVDCVVKRDLVDSR